jgi:hypothetical protein
MPFGDIDLKVTFNTTFYQIQGELDGDNLGIYENEGNIDFFIVDEDNFNKYKNEESFICHEYINKNKGNIFVNTEFKNWYIVFRNNGRKSNAILNFSVEVDMSTTEDKVQIVSPDTVIFDNPVYNIGETVKITGIATDDILLFVNGLQYNLTVENYEWEFIWNTSNLSPNNYSIIVKCGESQDELIISLIDVIPPMLTINNPCNGDIVNDDLLIIEGTAFDNQCVEKIEVSVDNGEWIEAIGTDFWFIDWNLNNYSIGEHRISARSFDIGGIVSFDEISIVLNESGHSWGPVINDFYHQPDNPSNISNNIIYANVTSDSPFSIKKVVLFWDDGNQITKNNMFLYANNPIQDRHEEDPLKNMSNDPIFGLELGQFSNNTNISYWVQAFDTADNSATSIKKYFFVN